MLRRKIYQELVKWRKEKFFEEQKPVPEGLNQKFENIFREYAVVGACQR